MKMFWQTKLQKIRSQLDEGLRLLVIQMKKVAHVDQSGFYALGSAITELQARNFVVIITGLQPQPLDMMIKIDIVPALITKMYMFDTFKECEDWLKQHSMDKPAGFDKIVEELHEVMKSRVANRM
tara:strand:- start:792 stop:1166 length:375 start_codon:yes stop_codon:yes gene_type:complete